MCDAMWGQSYIKYLMANEEMVSGDVDEATDTSEASKHVDRCTLHASISVIHTEIKAGHKDMWKELDCFCKTVKRDMKAEFGNFLRRSWPEAHPVQTDRLRSTLSRNNLHIFGITGGVGGVWVCGEVYPVRVIAPWQSRADKALKYNAVTDN